jgi:hypothetical protein
MTQVPRVTAMPPTSAVLQTMLLELLADRNTDKRLGMGQHALAAELKARLPEGERPTAQQIMAAMWSLVGQGLAYIDISEHAPENWKLALSESGTAAVQDQQLNPDNAGEYLNQLMARVPGMSDTVAQYTREALASYTNRCYLASAVMLDVAAEAAFLEMAGAFCGWVPDGSGQALQAILDRQDRNYILKFEEFRKRLGPHKPALPSELKDNMTLRLDAILDLLRVYRNDAGHPTGKQIPRADAFLNLVSFAHCVERLYALKAHFEK